MFDAILYPQCQLLMENSIDWSPSRPQSQLPLWPSIKLVDFHTGHAKFREDAVACNVDWCGDQPKMRPSVIVDGCLGPGAQLQIGDTQHMVFQEGCPKPQFEPETKQVQGRMPMGKRSSLVDGVKQHEEVHYVGQAKLLKQILWERGLWKECMVQKIKKMDGADEDIQGLDESHDNVMTKVLGNCQDFATEINAFQELMYEYVHLAEMSRNTILSLQVAVLNISVGKQKFTSEGTLTMLQCTCIITW